MFGFNGAPAPQGAAPPPDPFKPSALDVALGVLFDGQSPAQEAMRLRGQKAAMYQNQLLMQTMQNATPEQRQAMLFNGSEYGKAVAANFAPIQTSEGATQTMFGGQTQPGGYGTVAPKMMVEAGNPIALTQNGAVSLGARLPGKQSVDPESGGVIDENLGPTGGQFSRWRDYDPAHVAGPAFGGVRGVNPGQPLPVAGVQASPQGQAAQPAANAPRGIRNNNFGNLMALPHGQMWNGQTGVDDRGYAVFATPEDGVKAAATNLQSYAAKHGINTIAGVIQRWAPAGFDGNHTGHYINYVAQRMGVDPNAPLNMTDPAVQKGLLDGIFHFENGPKQMAGWRKGGQGAQDASGPPAANLSPSFAPVSPGRLTTPVAAGDPALRGVAPGTKLQRDAHGNISTFAKPSTEDQSTVQGYRDTAKTAEDMAALGDRFLHLNTRTATGLGYEPLEVPVPFSHGGHINLNVPGAIGERVHHDVPEMENLTTQMALAQRSPGMRVTQMEFQKFLGTQPGVENFPGQNTEIVKGYHQLAGTRRAYANFMSDWLAQHGSLSGADEAWGARQKQPQQGGSSAPKMRTYNPKTGNLE